MTTDDEKVSQIETVSDDDAPRALAQICEHYDPWLEERCRTITLGIYCRRHRMQRTDPEPPRVDPLDAEIAALLRRATR